MKKLLGFLLFLSFFIFTPLNVFAESCAYNIGDLCIPPIPADDFTLKEFDHYVFLRESNNATEFYVFGANDDDMPESYLKLRVNSGLNRLLKDGYDTTSYLTHLYSFFDNVNEYNGWYSTNPRNRYSIISETSYSVLFDSTVDIVRHTSVPTWFPTTHTADYTVEEFPVLSEFFTSPEPTPMSTPPPIEDLPDVSTSFPYITYLPESYRDTDCADGWMADKQFCGRSLFRTCSSSGFLSRGMECGEAMYSYVEWWDTFCVLNYSRDFWMALGDTLHDFNSVDNSWLISNSWYGGQLTSNDYWWPHLTPGTRTNRFFQAVSECPIYYAWDNPNQQWVKPPNTSMTKSQFASADSDDSLYFWGLILPKKDWGLSTQSPNYLSTYPINFLHPRHSNFIGDKIKFYGTDFASVGLEIEYHPVLLPNWGYDTWEYVAPESHFTDVHDHYYDSSTGSLFYLLTGNAQGQSGDYCRLDFYNSYGLSYGDSVSDYFYSLYVVNDNPSAKWDSTTDWLSNINNLPSVPHDSSTATGYTSFWSAQLDTILDPIPDYVRLDYVLSCYTVDEFGDTDEDDTLFYSPLDHGTSNITSDSQPPPDHDFGDTGEDCTLLSGVDYYVCIARGFLNNLFYELFIPDSNVVQSSVSNLTSMLKTKIPFRYAYQVDSAITNSSELSAFDDSSAEADFYTFNFATVPYIEHDEDFSFSGLDLIFEYLQYVFNALIIILFFIYLYHLPSRALTL